MLKLVGILILLSAFIVPLTSGVNASILYIAYAVFAGGMSFLCIMLSDYMFVNKHDVQKILHLSRKKINQMAKEFKQMNEEEEKKESEE